MEKKLTEEEIDDIKDKMADFFVRTNAKVLPEEEYQAGLKRGVPIICSPWSQAQVSFSEQVWKNEKLKNVLKRQCSICKQDICLAELNEAATFPICIECFITHKEDFERDDPSPDEIGIRKDDSDGTVREGTED